MSCLIEFFGELFFELIVYCYMKLMQLIVPNKTISEKTEKTIKDTVTTVAAILFIILIIGIILLLAGDKTFNIVGRYMTFIPLSIILLQIMLGIAIKIITHYKNKSSNLNSKR